MTIIVVTKGFAYLFLDFYLFRTMGVIIIISQREHSVELSKWYKRREGEMDKDKKSTVAEGKWEC